MGVQMKKADLENLIAEVLEAKTGAKVDEWKAYLDERLREFDETKETRIIEAGNHALERMPEYYRKEFLASGLASTDEHKGAGLLLGRFCRVMALAKSAGMREEDAALLMKDKWMAEKIEEAKALGSSVAADGGIFIPVEISNDFIELLRAKNVVIGLGARQLVLKGNALSMGRQTGTTTGEWLGENVQQLASQAEVGSLDFNLKRLQAITAASNQFLSEAGATGDSWIRDDLLAELNNTADAAFIRGTGGQSSPKGIRYRVNSANVSARTQASGTGSTNDEIIGDFFDMLEEVEGSNIDVTKGATIMPSRTKNGLCKRRDSDGDFIFKDDLMAGKFMLFPVGITNSIPKNLGSGDETEVTFADMDKCVVASNSSGMSVKAFDGGAYKDSSGNVVSGVAADQTVIRAGAMFDFGMRYDLAGSVRTAVDWYDLP